MKKGFLVWVMVLFFYSGNIGKAQNANPTKPKTENKLFTDYVNVEHKPEFPGGTAAYEKYIRDNMKNPEPGPEDKRVYVCFVIEKDGSISNVKVMRGIDKPLNDEAVRLIKGMPKWKAGTQNNQLVAVRHTLPVLFPHK